MSAIHKDERSKLIDPHYEILHKLFMGNVVRISESSGIRWVQCSPKILFGGLTRVQANSERLHPQIRDSCLAIDEVFWYGLMAVVRLAYDEVRYSVGSLR